MPDAGPAEPADEAYDHLFEQLLERLRTDLQRHRGSWWHNLFHR